MPYALPSVPSALTCRVVWAGMGDQVSFDEKLRRWALLATGRCGGAFGVPVLIPVGGGTVQRMRGRHHKSIILCCEALDPFKPEVIQLARRLLSSMAHECAPLAVPSIGCGR